VDDNIMQLKINNAASCYYIIVVANTRGGNGIAIRTATQMIGIRIPTSDKLFDCHTVGKKLNVHGTVFERGWYLFVVLRNNNNNNLMLRLPLVHFRDHLQEETTIETEDGESLLLLLLPLLGVVQVIAENNHRND
jgi:hypothetical protein